MTATNQPVDSQQWRLSFGHVIRSEYLKLVTLRSLRWTFVITLILLVGTNLLIASLLDTADLREASKAGNFAVLIEFSSRDSTQPSNLMSFVGWIERSITEGEKSYVFRSYRPHLNEYLMLLAVRHCHVADCDQ